MELSKKWTKENLIESVKSSYSIRQVLQKIGLKEAGGNYEQIKKYIKIYQIDSSHFLGRSVNKGRKLLPQYKKSLKEILVTDSEFQSHKLKIRLFKEKIKKPECEICGWSQMSIDGRIPVELDHINGNHRDNRIQNLRILCPNCHSVQVTHRGKNKYK